VTGFLKKILFNKKERQNRSLFSLSINLIYAVQAFHKLWGCRPLPPPTLLKKGLTENFSCSLCSIF